METTMQRELTTSNGKQNVRVQLLTFKLDEQEFALYIENVVQVVRMVALTRAPQAPPYVEGILNLRGRVIPVINLRNRCGLPSKPYDLDTQLLIARAPGKTMAFTVDNVSKVLNVSARDLEPPHEMGAAMQYISAVALVGDRLILVMDPAALMSDENANMDLAVREMSLEKIA